MNLAPVLTAKDLGGLFELDAEGTIIYSRLRKNKEMFETEPGVVGHNFFDEVAAFENVDDFRRRFMYFVKGSSSIENFNFDFRFEENAVPMRVMLVRVSENGFGSSARLVIVDIRKI
ncbi:MAG TPA: hypothetical protein VGC76_19590 [Pyrinomonadaceae bacterium]|jgi:hypothetical protein